MGLRPLRWAGSGSDRPTAPLRFRLGRSVSPMEHGAVDLNPSMLARTTTAERSTASAGSDSSGPTREPDGLLDVRLAMTDMARQLKACRTRDGLTLQQLASRCGVAASTIHKIEAQQMVPTVSVLLKIARGLGRRPEELVRDRYREVGEPEEARRTGGERGPGAPAATSEEERFFDRGVGAWRIDYGRGEQLGPMITLVPSQRAILICERGQGELSSHSVRTRLSAGECIDLLGEQFTLTSDAGDPIAVLLVASPAGRLAEILGPPNAAPRPHPLPVAEPASGPAPLGPRPQP